MNAMEKIYLFGCLGTVAICAAFLTAAVAAVILVCWLDDRRYP
jgi:hypothetical protein